jgi:lipopolysaccharide export system permease protein
MKRLDRYVEASTFRTLLLVASGLTGLFSLLEFVDQLRDVGQGHYGVLDAFIYVALTIPSRLLQVMPVAFLLASLFALGGLSNDSELIAMQAIGLSERQIVGWVLKLAVPIVIVLFLVAEFVIPPAQRLAQAQRMSAMASEASLNDSNGFWAQSDHQYLNVRWVDPGNVPRDIDIYGFSKNGELETFIHADSAKIQTPDTWLLSGVLRKQLLASEVKTERLDTLPWSSFLRPPQVQLLILPAESMPPIELYGYIRELKQHHHQAARLEQAFWTKVSMPLPMIAMILVSAPFVFGPPRARSAGQRITIGVGIGIVFTLFQQITSLVSLLLDLNPAFAAMAPSLLLIAATHYVYRRAAS